MRLPTVSAHARAQAFRFLRLFLATGVVSDVTTGNLSKSAIMAAIVAALETTVRQFVKVAPPAPAVIVPPQPPSSSPPSTPSGPVV